MPAHVMHILGTGELVGASIADMVRTLARHLDHRDYRLDACFLGPAGPWTAVLDAAGVSAFEVPWRSPLDVGGAFRFGRFLRSRRVDLLHVHYGGRSVRALARVATRAPLVMHLHGRVRNESDYRPVPLRLKDVDLVIATSRAVADLVKADRVHVVYPGVPMTEPSATREPWTIGAAGRLVPIKGYDVLLEAFAGLRARHPAARLEIAGEGPSRSDLESQARSLNIVDAVTFLGWRTDLQALMSRWAVFVQPSREEALGVAVLQAMASGSCVVASDVGGLPEIIQAGVTGVLVSPANVHALMSALAELLQRPDRRQSLGEAAWWHAQQFSESRFAAGIADVYRDLLLPRPDAATSS
jgi:glycosyltransferase involved in cell wall biosynthesis